MPKKDRLPSPGAAGTKLRIEACRSCRILDQGAALRAVAAKSSPAIWLVNICEHRAKTSYRCQGNTIGAPDGEGRFGDDVPAGVNNGDALDALKMVA